MELLPLKYSGAACAKYFTKYLTKAVASEKNAGDEKCRLFGSWGGVRFVYPRFSFVSSRIIQKRKLWLCQVLELDNPTKLPQTLGPHWWFHFGAALLEVVMPAEFYQVGPAENLQWDEIGRKALARDWAAWPETPTEDVADRSKFALFRDIGAYLFKSRSDALRFAMYLMSRPEPTT